MYIKEVIWLDEESKEAKLLVTDGVCEVECFSHPFNGKKDDILTDPICCLEVKDVILSCSNDSSIQKNRNEYHVTGLLVSKKPQIVKAGKILIDLGNSYIPNDIKPDDHIAFSASRFDVY